MSKIVDDGMKSKIKCGIVNVDDVHGYDQITTQYLFDIVYIIIQRPFSVTQETPRGGGLDLFPKKTRMKQQQQTNQVRTI